MGGSNRLSRRIMGRQTAMGWTRGFRGRQAFIARQREAGEGRQVALGCTSGSRGRQATTDCKRVSSSRQVALGCTSWSKRCRWTRAGREGAVESRCPWAGQVGAREGRWPRAGQ